MSASLISLLRISISFLCLIICPYCPLDCFFRHKSALRDDELLDGAYEDAFRSRPGYRSERAAHGEGRQRQHARLHARLPRFRFDVECSCLRFGQTALLTVFQPFPVPGEGARISLALALDGVISMGTVACSVGSRTEQADAICGVQKSVVWRSK